MAQHRLGDLKISDNPILERTDRSDIAGCTPQHPLGLLTHGKHLGGAGLHGDNGRFAQDDAVILDIDQRIGGTEINADIA